MTTTNKALALWQSGQPIHDANPATLVAQGIGDTGAFVLEYGKEQDTFVLSLAMTTGAGGRPLDLSLELPATVFRDFFGRRSGALIS